MQPTSSIEAIQRKERSEALLKADGVPINHSLPVIETEKESRRRMPEEVALRALALLVVAAKGEGLPQAKVDRVVVEYGLTDHFSPKEVAFINDPSPGTNDCTQFVWRYEGAWALLWSLGYVERLGVPKAICDVQHAVRFMIERTTAQFIHDAKLRPQAEILDQADLIYRYDWAVVDARIHTKSAPAGLDPGVTWERHYALNWLIGYMDQDWDDITTDT